MAQDDPAELERSVPIAFGASLFAPGLGHWYVGHMRVAIGFVLVLALGLPVVLVTSALLEFYGGIWVLVTGAWVLRLAAAFHAAWLARTGRGRARRGQTTMGYVAFFVVTAGLQFLSSATSRDLVLEPFSVVSESMRPALAKGDNFTIAKLLQRDRTPQRGDIVVYELPGQPGTLMVHRVVGLPGETLLVPSEGPPSIDGTPLDWTPCEGDGDAQCFVETIPGGVSYRVELRTSARDQEPAPIEVPAEHVLILGDNRHQSHDSRAIGPVPIEAIAGRAVERYWPPARIGSLVPTQ